MNETFIAALLIFVLRIIDVSLAITRILMVMRGRKALAWVFGFFQALVFIVAIREVMSELGNWTNMMAYAAGFATGNVVGIWLESKIAVGEYGGVTSCSPRTAAERAGSFKCRRVLVRNGLEPRGYRRIPRSRRTKLGNV